MPRMSKSIMQTEWYDRLRHWIRVLEQDFYKPLGPIEWKAYPTYEELSADELPFESFTPAEPGFSWGHTWEYCWFAGSVTIPEEAAGERVVMKLEPGAESTLIVNGRAFGTYRAPWIPPEFKHHYYLDNALTVNAVPGEKFDILMETYAGHFIPETSLGPIIDEEHYGDHKPEGARCTLGPCSYGIFREEAYQLYMDVVTLKKLMDSIDQNSLRAAEIADALENFTMIVDFEQPEEKRLAMYREAREALKPVLSAKNGTAPTFYAFGHAHLDLAWLWPTAETNRKTARTFAAQLRLMDQYPEYRFVQSQPAAYEMCRKYYPELFARIKQAVKEGKWIADGGMWVEPDTNMTGGEAMIRQILYGRKYYREELGADSRVLFLPDTFGYTAALPQIMKECGIRYIITSKIYWNYNDGEEFPYHYFYWEGIDGTKVTAFLPTEYGYRMDPARLNEVWENRRQKRGLDSFLVPYGYGDGGGGPTRDHIEHALREKDLEGSVKVKLASPREFFEDMEAKGGPKETYTGEMYFNAHRGTYTSQAKVKENNRRAEEALREMELYGAAASKLGNGYAYDAEKGEALWKNLLFHQFHDILPGSSIHRVYEEAEASVGKTIEEAGELASEARKALSREKEGAVSVFNSLGFARTETVALPDCFADGAAASDGQAVIVEKTDEGVKARLALPALGAVTLTPAAQEASEKTVSVKKEDGCFVLENDAARYVIDDNGRVTSAVLKANGREYAKEPMNVLKIFQDLSRHNDAWDIDTPYLKAEPSFAFDVTVEGEDASSAIEASVKVSGKIGESAYSQKITLTAGSPRLDFETDIDWKELHRLLKADFPVNIQAYEGINEIQFGYIKRPTHRSKQYDKDRYEVCNHRYSALATDSHGAAILNNSKYGISMEGSHLALTLLKAAGSPDFRADNRKHHFVYSFFPYEGEFAGSGVQREALALNVKPRLEAGEALVRESLLTVDRPNVIIDTVKLAEDGSGDVIVRLYESMNEETKVTVGGPLVGETAVRTNMEEEEKEKLAVQDGKVSLTIKPFEIVTLRL